MTDEDKMRLEIAKTAVLQRAINWRNTEYRSNEEDKAAFKLKEAVDHYEDVRGEIEAKADDSYEDL